MLVSGVREAMIGSFPILNVFGFVVMFGGVVYAITGPQSAGWIVADRLLGAVSVPRGQARSQYMEDRLAPLGR